MKGRENNMDKMTKEEIINQLEDLKAYAADMCSWSDLDDIWHKDVKALSEAIKILKEM